MTETLRNPASQQARREQRETWLVPHTAEIRLRVPGAGDIQDDVIRNVSISGASVLVRQALAVGSVANVVLHTAGANLEFMANVAWCRLAGQSDLVGSELGPEAAYALGLSIRAPGSFASMLQGSA
jgi:hypothetical protein